MPAGSLSSFQVKRQRRFIKLLQMQASDDKSDEDGFEVRSDSEDFPGWIIAFVVGFELGLVPLLLLMMLGVW